MRAETEAALTAVGLALDMMARRVGADRVASKGGRDLVTETDVAVEDAVRASLRARYPGWIVVGEERVPVRARPSRQAVWQRAAHRRRE